MENENISLPCVCYKTLIEKKLMIDLPSFCFNGMEECGLSWLIHGRSENVQDLTVGVATWCSNGDRQCDGAEDRRVREISSLLSGDTILAFM